MSQSDKIVKADTISITIRKLMDEFIYTIDLDADYQREKLWSTPEQRLLLDSILKDIDIPKLYLAKTVDNQQFDYECIDGKQRLSTLLSFFKPEIDHDRKGALTIPIFNRDYSYEELKKDHPQIAKKIENYKLDFVTYDMNSLDDSTREQLIREIFKRLQLGIRLNSGERLKALQGTIRDFVFDEMGNSAPFLRNTDLSVKRFSREFTLAQICLNSFKRQKTAEFSRARLLDLEDFFNDNSHLGTDDPNLERVRSVLGLMDTAFGARAVSISSRAVAVSGYLFAEGLYLNKRQDLLSEFAVFYVELLNEIRRNMEFLKKYTKVENPEVMEGFQKYILQASVEPSSLRRRDDFLRRAFEFFLAQPTRGKIIGCRPY